MKSLFPAFAFLGISFANAATLTTEHYVVTIERHCGEGYVTCEDVTYTGTNRKSGASITLKGTTWHTKALDGSPGRFLGYQFSNGNITYLVLEEGVLQVIQDGNNVLLKEEGTWE